MTLHLVKDVRQVKKDSLYHYVKNVDSMIMMTILFLLLAVGYPVLDRIWMKRIDAAVKMNKKKMYAQIILLQWATTALVVGYWSVANKEFTSLGFTIPEGSSCEHVGIIVGIITGLLINTILIMTIPAAKRWFHKQLEAIEFMMPETTKDRLLFAAVAMTAGFCEEVMFRGCMMTYLEQFDLSVMTAAIISSIVFGIVHMYQGWKNVVLTGLMGFLLARIYMSTGSLFIPIIFHILIDLRFALFPSRNAVNKETLVIQK